MSTTDRDTASDEAATGDGRGGRAEEIRQAAARIFFEKGYDSTSIQDIADAVGILKGSMYYHIDTKEDLLFDVVKSVHEQGLRQARQWMEAPGSPLERLRAAIEGHVESNLTNLEGVGVFFHDFASLGPRRRAEIITDRDFYDRHLRRLVEEGQASGDLAPDLDPKMAVMALLGMMNWTYQWFRPDGEWTPREVAVHLADLAIGGLARRPVPVGADDGSERADDA
jgi:AcrR family transcriptional regulator